MGRAVQMALAILAVILAVAVVTSVTVDLGPALKGQAERQATNFLKRPMHIGSMSIRLWSGRFVFTDLVIEGRTAESRPFLVAKLIEVSMPWSTLFNRRLVFDAIEMTDWQMYVETNPDGTVSFPSFTRGGPRGPSRWTTTLQWVRAHRGEFTYEDHVTPWSVVTRNLDVIVARPSDRYRGQAKFSNGAVAFQQYVPFRIDMSSDFAIDGSLVRFDRIDLSSDGAETDLTGVADMSRFPEMTYQMKSAIDFPAQKAIWFARDTFTVDGTGDFVGTFHMFRETMPNGRRRTGRELKGTFTSRDFGVNQHRFGDLRGSVLWMPEKLEITDATASVYGGTARFDYLMGPLGQPGNPAQATFDAEYTNVDLTTVSNFYQLQGIALAGRATGRNLLKWPLGRFAQMTSVGEVSVVPPGGVELMTRELPMERIAARAELGIAIGPFSRHTPLEPVPVGGSIAYSMGPEWLDLGASVVATPDTYVEFEGRSAYGQRSRIPFHVTSSDWQESDRLLAGLMTAFGAPTPAIPIGGYGSFDGVMLNEFRRPRIEGTFAGEQMRAFDVVWGSARGRAVIENSYADVTDIVIGQRRVDDHGERPLLAGLSTPRRRRGNQRHHPDRPASHCRSAARLRPRRLRPRRHVLRRVPRLRQLPDAARLRGDDDHRRRRLYRAVRARHRRACVSKASGVRLDDIELLKGGGRGTGAAYRGLERHLLLQHRRAQHPGGVAGRRAGFVAAVVGPARFHGRRQRHLRDAALRRSRHDPRLLRRRRRHRPGRRRPSASTATC